ncbi:MAG: hypothetical protein N2053_01365 [Chitinispirillaceae bacterium]|nr:hypothetical protein [Chitinispirillaceae bacterium]
MYLKISSLMLTIVTIIISKTYSEPSVSFGGYLDADVWSNLAGKYFANSELDLGMEIKYSENLSSHFYATVWSANGNTPGSIPAGMAPPEERWLSVLFDGFDITYTTPFGKFTAGDMVYQFGKFNYYFYKRLSMIAPETFIRGAGYSISKGFIEQSLMAGVTDKNSNTADVIGITRISLATAGKLGIFYGIRTDALKPINSSPYSFAGIEYKGKYLNEMLSIKADLSYRRDILEKTVNTVSFLFEPALSIGKFSTSFTGFVMLDSDSEFFAGSLIKSYDEMFFYLEPGYSFTDVISAGLPLEYHAGDLAIKEDNAFWIVPTFYIFPHDKVQWWLWIQFVLPEVKGIDKSYGIGSEIIVEF